MRQSLRLGSCLAVISLCATYQAHAQADGGVELPPFVDEMAAGGADAENPHTVLQRVTVTARKREEDANDVPSAATFIGQDDLKRTVLESGSDLSRLTPGVSLANSGLDFNTELIVRGQGAGSSFRSSAPAAAGLYRDGGYIGGGVFGGRNFIRMDYEDVERIEVLKGPQAALYGRNALGGALNIITRAPVLGETSLDLSAAVGTNEAYTFSGAANVAISDDTALRIAGLSIDQKDGFYKDAEGEPLDWKSQSGARVGLLHKFDDGARLRLTGLLFDETTPGPSVYVFDPLLDPDPYKRDLDTESRFERRTADLQFEYTRPLGQNEFTLLGLYRNRDASIVDDRDELISMGDAQVLQAQALAPFDPAAAAQLNLLGQTLQNSRFYTAVDNAYSLYSIESRLARDFGDRRGFIGVEAFTSFEKSETTDFTDCATGDLTMIATGCGTPATNPLAALAASPNPLQRQQAIGLSRQAASLNRIGLSKLGFDSISAFASLENDLTDRFTLTLDGRVTYDKQDYRSYVEKGAPLDPLTAPVIENDANTVFRTDELASTVFSPAASLRYDIDDERMVYLRYASGYRPGGFNLDITTNLNNPGAIPETYEEETNQSIEFGLRSQRSWLYYDFSAYWMLGDDVIIQDSYLEQGSPNIVLTNGGSTRQYGIESQLKTVFGLTPSARVIISAAGSWQEGKYTSDVEIFSGTDAAGTPVVPIQLNGMRIGLLPTWEANVAVTLQGDFNDRISGFASLEYSGAWDQVYAVADDGLRTIDDETLLNLKLGLDFDGFSLVGQVRNLTDEDFLIAPTDSSGFSERRTEPRSWMVAVRKSF